jgi:hypothetical protein
MPTWSDRSSRVLESAVFKTLMLSLMALLLLAFWLLCTHQVRQYESRRLAQQVQLTAFGDCLQYVVGSTIASCTNRLGRLGGRTQDPAAPQDEGLPNALPVPPAQLARSTGVVGVQPASGVSPQPLRVVAVPLPPLDTR